MAKRVSSGNSATKVTRKPVLFKLVTGKNGRTLYIGTVENKGSYKGQTLVLITGEEWDNDAKAMVRREIRGFIHPSISDIEIEIGDKLVICYAPAKNANDPGIIEEIAKPGQCMSIITEHENKDYQKVIIYGKPNNVKWNEKHNVFTVSFMDLTDTAGKDYGYESKWKDDRDGEEYVAYWTNVSFFGTTGQDKFQNRYPADRAENDIHAGDTVVIMSQYRESVDRDTGKTYINHNANKYMVLETSAQNSTPVQNTEENAVVPSNGNSYYTENQPPQTAPMQPNNTPSQPNTGYGAYPNGGFAIPNNVGTPTTPMDNNFVPDDDLPF